VRLRLTDVDQPFRAWNITKAAFFRRVRRVVDRDADGDFDNDVDLIESRLWREVVVN
jgi:hypothetical protein